MSTCKKHGTEYTDHCKACHVERQQKYRNADPVAEKARRARYYEELLARQINAPAEKVCSKCLKPKSILKFIARHDTKDGHAGECSACRSKANRNREAAKTQAAQPVWLTVHKMDDSPHSTINRVSLPARAMSSLEY